jgi:two-component system OmpR family response regulator
VLVVDDREDVTESLVMLLGMGGHEVRTAPDGPAALELAPSFLPDVVLIDIGMQGMDGYEVARRLRQQPRLRGVLLAALTGYAGEEASRLSREAGFDRHLVKPVNLRDLQALVLGRGTQPSGGG